MQTLILKLDTVAHATQLAKFFKTIPYVKSVHTGINEMDWTTSGRPATGEEIDQMLNECESDEITFTTDELKKRLSAWTSKK